MSRYFERSRVIAILFLLVATQTGRGEQPPAVPAATPVESVLDRYQPRSNLPELTGTDYGPAGLYGPPGGTYYRARSHYWGQVDYLLWWMQGEAINTLATDPNGNSVLGGNRLNDDARSGVRVRGGYNFDCDALCGVMVDYWSLGSHTETAAISNGAANGLLFPFTDMDLTLPSNQINGCVCLDLLVGTAATLPLNSLSVASQSQIWSGSGLLRGRLYSSYCCQDGCGCCPSFKRNGFRVDGLFGYRYLDLDESMVINSSLSPATGVITGVDRFATDNDYHGVDFGIVGERECGRWSLEAVGRCGLGINRQTLMVSGSGNRLGGVFAQTTNIGTFQHDAVTVIPELNLTAGYALTPNIRARCGYTFLWLSNVLRPAKQIDTRIDGRFLNATVAQPIVNPPAFFPAQRFETESVWLQGLNFGLEAWF
ncbi:MAG: BBP7 family outer membrane beta-barrel protein [Planctomycetales bacterium]|nr:BBP7 family outer membrane beta-barrel protein [Planctomycetales bacterium]